MTPAEALRRAADLIENPAPTPNERRNSFDEIVTLVGRVRDQLDYIDGEYGPAYGERNLWNVAFGVKL